MTKETQSSIHLAPVAKRVDNAIHWINRCRVQHAVFSVNTFQLDSDSSVEKHYPPFEQEDPLPLRYIVHALLAVKKT